MIFVLSTSGLTSKGWSEEGITTGLRQARAWCCLSRTLCERQRGERKDCEEAFEESSEGKSDALGVSVRLSQVSPQPLCVADEGRDGCGRARSGRGRGFSGSRVRQFLAPLRDKGTLQAGQGIIEVRATISLHGLQFPRAVPAKPAPSSAAGSVCHDADSPGEMSSGWVDEKEGDRALFDIYT